MADTAPDPEDEGGELDRGAPSQFLDAFNDFGFLVVGDFLSVVLTDTPRCFPGYLHVSNYSVVILDDYNIRFSSALECWKDGFDKNPS